MRFHDRAQTLQVTDEAADLIDSLGYGPGDSILRGIIRLLLITDLLYIVLDGPSAEESLAELPRLDPNRFPAQPNAGETCYAWD